LDYVTVEIRGQDVFEAEEVLPISKIALEAYGVGMASQPPIGGTSIDAVTTIHATILDKLTNAIATQIGEFESFVRDRHEELEKQSRDNEDRWKVGFLPLTKSMQIKLLLSMKETLRLIDVKLNSITRAILMRVVKYVVSSTRGFETELLSSAGARVHTAIHFQCMRCFYYPSRSQLLLHGIGQLALLSRLGRAKDGALFSLSRF
jgi:hypothetical protein